MVNHFPFDKSRLVCVQSMSDKHSHGKSIMIFLGTPTFPFLLRCRTPLQTPGSYRSHKSKNGSSPTRHPWPKFGARPCQWPRKGSMLSWLWSWGTSTACAVITQHSVLLEFKFPHLESSDKRMEFCSGPEILARGVPVGGT